MSTVFSLLQLFFLKSAAHCPHVFIRFLSRVSFWMNSHWMSCVDKVMWLLGSCVQHSSQYRFSRVISVSARIKWIGQIAQLFVWVATERSGERAAGHHRSRQRSENTSLEGPRSQSGHSRLSSGASRSHLSTGRSLKLILIARRNWRLVDATRHRSAAHDDEKV